jgi:hypothetical protein
MHASGVKQENALMDIQSATKPANAMVRQLTSLKILSRLLGHQLHAQGASKSVQLSREEVLEIQTTVDLFIEDIVRRYGTSGGAPAAEPQLVSARGLDARN